jgi:hypothetical protein
MIEILNSTGLVRSEWAKTGSPRDTPANLPTFSSATLNTSGDAVMEKKTSSVDDASPIGIDENTDKEPD